MWEHRFQVDFMTNSNQFSESLLLDKIVCLAKETFEFL